MNSLHVCFFSGWNLSPIWVTLFLGLHRHPKLWCLNDFLHVRANVTFCNFCCDMKGECTILWDTVVSQVEYIEEQTRDKLKCNWSAVILTSVCHPFGFLTLSTTEKAENGFWRGWQWRWRGWQWWWRRVRLHADTFLLQWISIYSGTLYCDTLTCLK